MSSYRDRNDLIERARYDTCLKALQFELDLFWKRSTVFWVVAAAAAGAFFEAHKNSNHKISVAIASFGFVSSIVWTMVNRGSKYWYENWEEKLKGTEGGVTGELYGALPEEKPSPSRDWFLIRARRYSPSKLAIALSDYVAVLWLCILVWEAIHLVRKQLWERIGFGDGLAAGFALLSIGYGVSLFWRCKPED